MNFAQQAGEKRQFLARFYRLEEREHPNEKFIHATAFRTKTIVSPSALTPILYNYDTDRYIGMR